jgi:hypothetical protein
VVIIALLILGGVAYYVRSDSRRHAPVKAKGSQRDDQRPVPGSKRPPKARKLSTAERKRRKRGRAR